VRLPVAINVNNKLVAERDVHGRRARAGKLIAQLLALRIIKIALNVLRERGICDDVLTKEVGVVEQLDEAKALRVPPLVPPLDVGACAMVSTCQSCRLNCRR
jgi:hypothetical protein